MKRFILIPVLSFMLTVLSAATISDIVTIQTVSQQIIEDANTLYTFSVKLKALADNNFSIEVFDSTQTITLSNTQKQGLIAKYNDLKAKLQADVDLLP